MNISEEEFVPEEETEGPALIKKLREKLKKAVEEKQEYLEGWQRARADFVNYKKSEAAAFEEKEGRLRAEFLKDLLPALDALELSLKHEPTPTLTMLQQQFVKALTKLGVERIDDGGTFDPKFHHALAEHKTENKKTDGGMELQRSGYKIGDHIIRPAEVILLKY